VARKQVRFGIIGLGLMGREIASNFARWCHLLDDGPVPVITAICDKNKDAWKWYQDNFATITLATDDYRKLIAAKEVDAVYCAVPHNLHETMYTDILKAGKHLLGEKPFGIDKKANDAIIAEAKHHPELAVRCTSEFPYYPACYKLIQWAKEKKYGRIMEVHAGFNHSSDLDQSKPINWKRMIAINGEYGCLGDLGMHAQHIPLRMGWFPKTVYADLQKIVETRPDGKGGSTPCETWDNATLICKCEDPQNQKPFTMYLETKRMEPGSTNRWFIEVYGTHGSARFTTEEPRTFYQCETVGSEQGWTRIDVGSVTFGKTITGGIFETGFSDGLLQMLYAFMQEFNDGGSKHPFPNVSLDETHLSHVLMTAALESNRTGSAVALKR
jgi:predicted dehydrogenase